MLENGDASKLASLAGLVSPSIALQASQKELELRKQNAMRQEKWATQEIAELTHSSKEMEESLQQLQTRLSALLAELSALHKKSTGHIATINSPKDDQDLHRILLLSYRDVTGAINTAFRDVLKEKISSLNFIERLSDQHAGSRPEYCRVVYESADGDESAEWKIFDPRDNTELTFGGLLDDVCRYWGIDRETMSLVDRTGAAWPLEAFVWDELSLDSAGGLSGTGGRLVWMRRLPHAKFLGSFAFEYAQDETECAPAIRSIHYIVHGAIS